jgi:outer membrane receptor protein involved in Fe transport
LRLAGPRIAFLRALLVRVGLALALLACPTGALAFPDGPITGTVVDATGAPLAGATVDLRSPAVSRTTVTDGERRFALAPVDPGSYELTIQLDGFATLTRQLRVARGALSSFTFTIQISAVERTVVTASRTGATSVRDTPLSVSPLDGGSLADLQRHTIEDVAGSVPSLTFSQNTGFSQLTIRGIGTNAIFAGSDPSSAVYLDGVYLARPAMALSDFFDVERVEVLRGPQGTLYGRNAVGGAVNAVFIVNPRHEVSVSGDVAEQTPVPLTYAKVLAVKPGFTVDNPADLHEVRTSTPAASRNAQYGAAIRYQGQLPNATTLTSLTAYRNLDYDVVIDGDITELELTRSDVHELHHQWSQELTLARQGRRLSWIGGLYLFADRDRQPTSVAFAAAGVENRLLPDVSTRSAAVPGSVYAYDDRITHAAGTPKVGLEFRPNARTVTYVSATRGFKSGGFNPTSPEAGRGFAPKWAWTSEAGVKTGTPGGRGTLAAAAYVTDYRDLQVQFAIRPGVIDISNAAAATILGTEVEAELGLSRSLRLAGHLAWLDATYDRYIAVGVGGVTADVSGNRLSNAPEWSGRLGLHWTRPAVRGTQVVLRAETRAQSTVFFTPFNDGIQRQRPFALVDAGADLRSGTGRWTIGVYGRNLTNRDYITGTFSSPLPAIGGRPGEPRQAGVQLSVWR